MFLCTAAVLSVLVYCFDNTLLIEIRVVQQQNEFGKNQKQQNRINLVCSTRIQNNTVIREVRYSRLYDSV